MTLVPPHVSADNTSADFDIDLRWLPTESMSANSEPGIITSTCPQATCQCGTNEPSCNPTSCPSCGKPNC